jgi:acyl dehydratase
MTRQLYADDFPPDYSFSGRWHTLDKAAFDHFASLTGDNHPIHYDDAYASRTRFGRPVAHGLLVMSLTAVGATDLSEQLHESMVAFAAVEAEFLTPVFVGDKIRPEFKVIAVHRRPGKTTARVEFQVEMRTQAGAVCLRGKHSYVLKLSQAESLTPT